MEFLILADCVLKFSNSESEFSILIPIFSKNFESGWEIHINVVGISISNLNLFLKFPNIYL